MNLILVLRDLKVEHKNKPHKSAVFSKCGLYRYELRRQWAHGETVCFIGLNPSTADATKDDPTIRRCIRFARDWGCSGLVMVNIFAYKSTKPVSMFEAAKPKSILGSGGVDIVGSENDDYIHNAIMKSKITIAAWGNHGDTAHAQELANKYDLHCLGLNKTGTPKHPLYVKAETVPMPFSGR